MEKDAAASTQLDEVNLASTGWSGVCVCVRAWPAAQLPLQLFPGISTDSGNIGLQVLLIVDGLLVSIHKNVDGPALRTG